MELEILEILVIVTTIVVSFIMPRERRSLTRLQFFVRRAPLQNLRLPDISVESRDSFYKNEITACVNKNSG